MRGCLRNDLLILRASKFEGRSHTPCIPVLVPPTADVLAVDLELDLEDAGERAHGPNDVAKAARVDVDLLAELCWQTGLGDERCHGRLQPIR